MKRLMNPTNAFFFMFLLVEALPSKKAGAGSGYVLGLVLLIQVFCLAVLFLQENREKSQTAGDVAAVVYFFIILWELFTSKLNLLDKHLYPAPGAIIRLFLAELPEMLKGLASSLQLLGQGYALALLCGVLLALFIGWRKRLYRAVKPFAKVLGPIPPIVYIPYAIAILPTFKASSVFIIFSGAFWPVFINTLNGVLGVERKIIDSARALHVKERAMLFQVILPAALPSIISGATIGLVMSFILLTAAEMIGATSGLGWYVKYFSDFGDYERVLVGILFIGMVVTVITFVFEKIEACLLRWRK